MKNIEVQVADDKVDIFLTIIQNLKDGIVKDIIIKSDKKVQSSSEIIK